MSLLHSQWHDLPKNCMPFCCVLLENLSVVILVDFCYRVYCSGTLETHEPSCFNRWRLSAAANVVSKFGKTQRPIYNSAHSLRVVCVLALARSLWSNKVAAISEYNEWPSVRARDLSAGTTFCCPCRLCRAALDLTVSQVAKCSFDRDPLWWDMAGYLDLLSTRKMSLSKVSWGAKYKGRMYEQRMSSLMAFIFYPPIRLKRLAGMKSS